MPRRRNAACMAALRYVSSGSLASVVLAGSVSRHHRKGSSPGTTDNYSPLQITTSAPLTTSAGSMMRQLSIVCFAEISWILHLHTNHWNTDPTRSIWQEHPPRRTSGDIHSCSVWNTYYEAAHSPTSRTNPSAPPSHTSPSSSPGQAMKPVSAPCICRHNQSGPSIHPSRGAATSATPASSHPHRHPAAPCHQCRRSRGAPSQPSRQSSSPQPPTAPATHTGNIPHHAATVHVRVGEPESMGHQMRGDAGGEVSSK
ncbi:hypothetical protein MOQ_007976 [Trypanosoma cruzi marinkellei]|uniref:Uncharacterized protein n=1 Tax=Trypanosoma cruzi marinkellei TaxID=85056 RepID=K2N122_TRYCR|nr:hypothetical protein MOQ_007976 [Trypanosoma cruzi marinkellei]